MSPPGEFREHLAEVLQLLADGKIRPVIAERLPLAEAAKLVPDEMVRAFVACGTETEIND